MTRITADLGADQLVLVSEASVRHYLYPQTELIGPSPLTHSSIRLVLDLTHDQYQAFLNGQPLTIRYNP